jgi:hypothetical protein
VTVNEEQAMQPVYDLAEFIHCANRHDYCVCHGDNDGCHGGPETKDLEMAEQALEYLRSTEHDYMPPVRGVGAPVQRADLLRVATTDARIQLASVRAEARLFRALYADPARAADEAEKHWRDKWPGLAALIDHADAGP